MLSKIGCWTALAALMLGATGPLHAQGSAQTVVHASEDDCKIIIGVGKKVVGWSDKPPTSVLFAEYDIAPGQVYVEDCDWPKFGVAAPHIHREQDDDKSSPSFYVARPAYNGSHAETEIDIYLPGGRDDKGNALRPYMRREHCEFERNDREWTLTKCEVTRQS